MKTIPACIEHHVEPVQEELEGREVLRCVRCGGLFAVETAGDAVVRAEVFSLLSGKCWGCGESTCTCGVVRSCPL